MSALQYLHLQTGDALLVGVTVVLIFLPSVVPSVGNFIGRTFDRLRGRTPEV